MSIRQIALDLYQREKDISRLRKELAQTPADKRDPIQERINQLTLERNKLKELLESKKKS